MVFTETVDPPATWNRDERDFMVLGFDGFFGGVVVLGAVPVLGGVVGFAVFPLVPFVALAIARALACRNPDPANESCGPVDMVDTATCSMSVLDCESKATLPPSALPTPEKFTFV